MKNWITKYQDLLKKDLLIEYRKKIEKEMEKFKNFEKEVKAKTYSKIRLSNKNNVNTLKQKEAIDWLEKQRCTLTIQLNDLESHMDEIQIKRAKNKSDNEQWLIKRIDKHKWQISKLKQLTVGIKNLRVDPDKLMTLQDDIRYYVDEAIKDENFYDDEEMYENLEDFPILNEDPKNCKSKILNIMEDKSELCKKKQEIRLSIQFYNLQQPVNVSNIVKNNESQNNNCILINIMNSYRKLFPSIIIIQEENTSNTKLINHTIFEETDFNYQFKKSNEPNFMFPKIFERTSPFVKIFPGNMTSRQQLEVYRIHQSFLALTSTLKSYQYYPKNPQKIPDCFPKTPLDKYQDLDFISLYNSECLFFMFHYIQGTRQQYLAAQELKRRSWIFHNKFLTWFQRLTEPIDITITFERGAYIYFEYENKWCQKKNNDFIFDYQYLEDEF